jgi:bifunctional DNA-binding transcriptional regulator/antitoxin component of YhaV-PrlF toxin-antitoxin module
MKSRPRFQAHVDDEGRLVFPAEVASRYGLRPGAQILVEDGANALRLR